LREAKPTGSVANRSWSIVGILTGADGQEVGSSSVVSLIGIKNDLLFLYADPVKFTGLVVR
jgi:hypothetical protein